MNKKRKSKGVSAVVGIILMVAVVVAIAATVYVYVSQYKVFQEESSVESLPIKMEIYSKEVADNRLNLKINFISDIETSQDQYGIVVEYQEEKPSSDHMSKAFQRVSDDSFDDLLCGELYPGNNVKVFDCEWSFPNSTGSVKEYKVVIYLLVNGVGAYMDNCWYMHDPTFVYHPKKALQTEEFSVFI